VNEYERKGAVLSLVRSLKKEGSWTGETHVQKAVYFLQQIAGMDLGFDFILYKHGPYSFDLTSEINAMRADDFLDLEPQPYPYGPSLHEGEASWLLDERYMRTANTHQSSIDAVAEAFDSHGVADLEAWATALYVVSEEGLSADRAPDRIMELKPHIDSDRARQAVEKMENMRDFIKSRERG
jgi:uncharacterized protein YwgA